MRVAVIGSGNRVRSNFMPALSWLDDHVEVTGLWSRTAANAEAVASHWGVPARDSLAALVATQPHVIAVSVSTNAVPELLRALARRAPEAALVLDTPVLGRALDLPAARYLPRFRRVLIAEDYMNYPHFELMRTVTATGAIGTVREVAMHGNGYRYHGLATIRSFFGFPMTAAIRRIPAGEGAVSLSFRFGSDRRGVIKEPYVAGRGHTTVTGSHGTITDDPEREDALLIEPTYVDGEVAGFRLADRELRLPQLAMLRRISPPETTLFNDLKTCGLIRVFESLWGDNLNSDYTYRQGLYDHLMTAIGRRLPLKASVPGTSPRSRAAVPIGR
jgi:hypothetical protein